jgi:GTPase involved in cell partitioning and DNA repair
MNLHTNGDFSIKNNRMSNLKNKKILIACNTLDFESLKNALNDKIVTIEELQTSMHSDKFALLISFLNEDDKIKPLIEEEVNHDDWFTIENNSLAEDSDKSLIYPNDTVDVSNLSAKSSEEIYNLIQSGVLSYETLDAGSIERLISSKLINFNTLRQFGFSGGRLKSLEYYCQDRTVIPTYSIDKLKPMQEGRTDLYFIGLSRAGKSTILSGILNSANKDGRWQPDTSYHPEGIKFKNKILNDLYEGVIPKATPADSYNYIAATFIDEKNEGHPFNIVEMPGEDFRKIQDDFREADKYLRYINNDNRKIITFVIDLDYKNSYMAQMNAYTNFISFFYEKGVLNNVESIYFVMNKIDLVIDQQSNKALIANEAVRIFNNEFKNLKKQTDYIRKESKSHFKLKLMPFSIGVVKNDKILEKFNNDFSRNILSNLINDSFKPKGGLFGKFFKSSIE